MQEEQTGVVIIQLLPDQGKKPLIIKITKTLQILRFKVSQSALRPIRALYYRTEKNQEGKPVMLLRQE